MGLFGTLVLPVTVFVLWAAFSAPGGLGDARSHLDMAVSPAGLRRIIAIGGVPSLVTIMSIYREGGILKRLRATPLRPVTILGAHVVVKLSFTVCGPRASGAGRQTLLPGRYR